MGTVPFIPATTLNPFALLAPDARATPGPAEKRQAGLLQLVLQADPPGGAGGYGGSWGSDRNAQTDHYRGVPAIAIQAYLDALSACKFTLQRRKDKTVTKSAAGAGNYARDDEYEPVGPDEHPLAKVLEQPGGEDGAWSIHQECAFLTLQYLLTGDAPAWTPCNDAGKPVRFFAMTSALTTPLYPAGANPQYPKGAYRVTPYGGSGFVVAGQLGSYAVLPGEEVARLRAPHPWSRSLGMSPLQVGDREVDCLEAITLSRWAMFDHGVQLDAALLMPGLGVEEGQAVQKQIEQKHGGAKHARRFLVLSGAGLDAKWDLKTFGQSAREMDFGTSYDQAAGVVLSLFRVPKGIANFNTELNYSALWAARQQFHELTISPYCRGRLSVFLTQALARRWEERPGELKIECEPQEPKNVEEDAKEKQFAVQSGIITVNEYRTATGRKEIADGELPLPAFTAKAQQAVAPQPQPGDPNAAPLDGADDQQQPQDDTTEAAQDAVTSAALGALGVPADDAEREQGAAQPFGKAIAVTKPGGTGPRPVRREGEVWQSGGKWYTKRGGKITETADPSKRGATAPPPLPGRKPAPAGGYPSRHNPGATYRNPADRDADDRAFDKDIARAQKDVRAAKAALAEAQSPKEVAALRSKLAEATRRAEQARAKADALRAGSGSAPAAEGPDHAAHDDLAKKLLRGRPGLRLLDGSLKGHTITDGASLREFFAKGGKLPTDAAMEAAKAVQIPGPNAQSHLSKAAQWAAGHADKHAQKVAAHFGISPERAHALLTHAIVQIAAHAAKSGGKVGTLSIRDKNTGRTAKLTPKAAPRPDNPGAEGSRPPVAKGFDPNENRDEKGRWSDGSARGENPGPKARSAYRAVKEYLSERGAADPVELHEVLKDAGARPGHAETFVDDLFDRGLIRPADGDDLRLHAHHPKVAPALAAVKDYLSEHGEASPAELVEHLADQDMTRGAARRVLQDLHHSGELVKEGGAFRLPPVAKAVNSLSGPDGGFLVPDGGVRVKRRRRKLDAIKARVMKSLEHEV